jgi:predicted PurR-regulated permease PerM
MILRSNPASILTQWTARQVILGTLVVLGVALGFWLLYDLRLVLFSLFLAIVISTAISPAVDWLYRGGISRGVGVVLIYLGLLLILLAVSLLVAPLVMEQGATIAANFSGYYQNFLEVLHGSSSRLIRRLALQLPSSLTVAPDSGQAGGEALDAVARALSYAGLIGQGLFVFTAVLLLAFYWTLERERLLRTLLLLKSSEQRESIRELIVTTEEKVGAYLRGIALLCLIVGSMALAVYLWLGLPYALLLGIIAGLLEAVPMVGPALGALPAVLVALSYDPSKAIWVVIATAVIQFIENTVLVPRVMRRTVGVSAVGTLLSLAAFGTLFGLAGAFLAVPMAVVLQVLLERFVLGPQALEPERPEGRDYFSVLRYQAQDLVQDVRKQVREKPEDLSEVSDEVEDAIEAIANDLDAILARAAPEAKPV